MKLSNEGAYIMAKIEQKEENGMIIYHFTEGFNSETVTEFDDMIEMLHDIGNGVIIDLSGIEGVNSPILQSFSRLSKVTKAFRKDFRIINVGNDVYDTLLSTGFIDLFHIEKAADAS